MSKGTWHVKIQLDREESNNPELHAGKIAKGLAGYNVDIVPCLETRLSGEEQPTEVDKRYIFGKVKPNGV